MTNEEIKQKFVEIWETERAREERLRGESFVHDVALPPFDERIRRASAKLCASLVSQAYEEAAQDAESYIHDIYVVQDVPAAMRCIATNIRQRKGILLADRAPKDSLVQEPVASS